MRGMWQNTAAPPRVRGCCWALPTPTVETFYHAQQGEYDLLELTERYNRRALPEVRIADLRQELRAGNSTVISRPLQEERQKTSAAGEQTSYS